MMRSFSPRLSLGNSQQITFAFLLFAVALPASANQKAVEEELDIDEGFQYELIIPPQPTANPDKIEVMEWFWYGCPHCYSFEPHLQGWLSNKPDDVDFVRMPAIFNAGWAVLAKAFYTAKALGISDQIHEPLFAALHKGKRKLQSLSQVEQFFVEHGVEAERFRKIYNSFSVQTKSNQAAILGGRYGIHAVPTIVIEGKYRVSKKMTDSYENMLTVTDYLIAKERAARKAASNKAPQATTN